MESLANDYFRIKQQIKVLTEKKKEHEKNLKDFFTSNNNTKYVNNNRSIEYVQSKRKKNPDLKKTLQIVESVLSSTMGQQEVHATLTKIANGIKENTKSVDYNFIRTKEL